MWYDTGTVSITSGQGVVTGVGTLFAANVRVGDAFKGPNGLTYEITAVPSNTSLSIKPNYAGPTVSGGAYSIMPVQGYVRLAIDALNALAAAQAVTSVAGKTGAVSLAKADVGLPLADNTSDANKPVSTAQASAIAAKQPAHGNLTALATVLAAADRVPMFTGASTAGFLAAGTTGKAVLASATAPAARTALSLGDAALATLSNSRIDSTLGRVLKVGDHGVGAESLQAILGIDIDSLRVNGFYYVSSGANQGSLPSSSNGYLWSRSVTPAYAVQVFCIVTSGVEYKRVLNNGTWTAWEVVNNPTVGVVSTAGGVPTGAVIERGSNGNGEYTRFADGTQICMVSLPQSAQAVNTASGNLFQSANVFVTWPMPFSGTPTVSSFVGRSSTDTICLGIVLRSLSSADCYFKWWSSFSSGSLGVFGSIIAIGRWF